MLIDIEGVDGSGKATQSRLLYEYLQSCGYNCKLFSFPNYDSESSIPVKMYLRGDLGENLNCLNVYQAAILYTIDRLLTMKPLDLSDYDYVIFDRYMPSNLIHRAAQLDDLNDVDKFIEWAEDLEYGKLELPKPDITILLDLPVEESIRLAHLRKNLKNGEARDIAEKDFSHLKKSCERAKYVANKLDWQVIDCMKNGQIAPVEEIQARIRDIISYSADLHI